MAEADGPSLWGGGLVAARLLRARAGRWDDRRDDRWLTAAADCWLAAADRTEDRWLAKRALARDLLVDPACEPCCCSSPTRCLSCRSARIVSGSARETDDFLLSDAVVRATSENWFGLPLLVAEAAAGCCGLDQPNAAEPVELPDAFDANPSSLIRSRLSNSDMPAPK